MSRASERQINRHKYLYTGSESFASGMFWKSFDAGHRCSRCGTRGKNRMPCSLCWGEHTPLVQAVPLRTSTTGLAVSVLRERAAIVITGFELLSSDGRIPNLTFGYRIPGRQVIIDLRDKTLTGFAIFWTENHIHAMLPIFREAEFKSSWIGHLPTCEETARLLSSQDTKWVYEPNSCKALADFTYVKCGDPICSEECYRLTSIVLDRQITVLYGMFHVRHFHLNIFSTEFVQLTFQY